MEEQDLMARRLRRVRARQMQYEAQYSSSSATPPHGERRPAGEHSSSMTMSPSTSGEAEPDVDRSYASPPTRSEESSKHCSTSSARSAAASSKSISCGRSSAANANNSVGQESRDSYGNFTTSSRSTTRAGGARRSPRRNLLNAAHRRENAGEVDHPGRRTVSSEQDSAVDLQKYAGEQHDPCPSHTRLPLGSTDSSSRTIGSSSCNNSSSTPGSSQKHSGRRGREDDAHHPHTTHRNKVEPATPGGWSTSLPSTSNGTRSSTSHPSQSPTHLTDDSSLLSSPADLRSGGLPPAAVVELLQNQPPPVLVPTATSAAVARAGGVSGMNTPAGGAPTTAPVHATSSAYPRGQGLPLLQHNRRANYGNEMDLNLRRQARQLHEDQTSARGSVHLSTSSNSEVSSNSNTNSPEQHFLGGGRESMQSDQQFDIGEALGEVDLQDDELFEQRPSQIQPRKENPIINGIANNFPAYASPGILGALIACRYTAKSM